MQQTYKLKRVFNLFNPLYIALIAIFLGVFTLIDIPRIIDGEILVTIAVIPVVLVTYCGYIIHISAREFTVKNKEITFCERRGRPNKHGITRGITIVVEYSVYKIENIEFLQNVIEKSFDVGHIVFSGKAFVHSDDTDYELEPPKKFKIYGIQNFKEFKEQYKDYFIEPTEAV